MGRGSRDRAPAMMLFESIDAIDLHRIAEPVHIAVGTFDGVHLAHRALLGRIAGEAHATGGLALVFTFQNHPRSVITPGEAPPLLTPWPFKRRLLRELPLDILVGVRFDHELMSISAPDFVRDVLVGRCRARTIHSGVNFRFGHMGYGGPGLLQDMAEDLNYRYEQLEPIKSGGHRISSTRIRQTLMQGNVAEAAEMLGRSHSVSAAVVSGDALGRTIGFPTANLGIEDDTFLPADGVYAVRVRIDENDASHPGMMNIGWRPTVGGRDHRAEVHLIDWNGDLSNTRLTVDFIQRLRGEQRFDGLEALKAQLEKDREAAKKITVN